MNKYLLIFLGIFLFGNLEVHAENIIIICNLEKKVIAHHGEKSEEKINIEEVIEFNEKYLLFNNHSYPMLLFTDKEIQASDIRPNIDNPSNFNVTSEIFDENNVIRPVISHKININRYSGKIIFYLETFVTDAWQKLEGYCRIQEKLF